MIVTRFLATSPQVRNKKTKVFVSPLFLFDTSENSLVEVLTTPSKLLFQTFEKCLFDLKKRVFKMNKKSLFKKRKVTKKKIERSEKLVYTRVVRLIYDIFV